MALEQYDDLGVGQEPNNLAAINSLKIFRTLRWGRNADLILTDNRSFQGPGNDGSAFDAPGFPLIDARGGVQHHRRRPGL